MLNCSKKTLRALFWKKRSQVQGDGNRMSCSGGNDLCAAHTVMKKLETIRIAYIAECP